MTKRDGSSDLIASSNALATARYLASPTFRGSLTRLNETSSFDIPLYRFARVFQCKRATHSDSASEKMSVGSGGVPAE